MNSNEIYVSLDIGTSSVKVIIGEMVNDTLNIIGVGNVKSKGLKKGSIVDIDETVNSIRKAIEQAERMVGIHIDHVIVGMGGSHVQQLPCHGVVAVSSENREITTEDVTRVYEAAKVMSIPPERMIIDTVAKQFIVDGLDEITDPRGMIGVRLEMEGSIITGSKTSMHNLLKCVEKAGITPTETALYAIAAGSVALSKEEKQNGVALIDIGGGSTTVSLFREGALTATTTIPLGGEHITKDISIGFGITTEEAEKIKLKYGHSFYPTASSEQFFSVSSSTMGKDTQQQYSQLELADIIEPRMEEIFDYIILELKKLGVRELPSGFVLTGGAVAMEGVRELAQDIFKTRIRIAIPDYIGVREPQYTTGVGLIQYVYQKGKLLGISAAPTRSHGAAPSNSSPPKGKKNANPEGETVMTKVKNVIRLLWE